MSSSFSGSLLYWLFCIILWSSLGRKQRYTESSPTPLGIGALPPIIKPEIEPHCVGVPKFIMCGSRNSGRQSVVSQENYNFLTNNMNKLLEEEKADKIREQYQETLPFDTETLFLVLVVGVVLAILSAGIYYCAQYKQARSDGAHARAARTLNIDAGGIGAPKHVLAPLMLEEGSGSCSDSSYRPRPRSRSLSRSHSCANVSCSRE